MPVGLIDSALFKDMFGTEPMRRIFSDEGLLGRYLDIEVALARAQARLGMIPMEAADEIARKAKIDNLDMAELKKQTELVGRIIFPLVQQLANACKGSADSYVHWARRRPTSWIPQPCCRSATALSSSKPTWFDWSRS